MIELRPKKMDKFAMNLVIHAIETPKEQIDGKMDRKLVVKPIIHRHLDLETGEG